MKLLISQMTYQQLEALHSDLTMAGVAIELREDWREIFRRRRHQHRCGYLHKLYTQLYKADRRTIEQCIGRLIEDIS